MSTLPASSLPPPPTPPPDNRTWGLGDAVITLAIFLFVSLAAGLVAIAASGGDDVLEGPWLPVAVVVAPLIQLFHITWIGREKGHGVAEDFGFRFRSGDLARGAALCVVGFIAAAIVGSVLFAIFDEDPSASVAEMAEDSAGDAGLTVWIVLLAIFAATIIPVVEELVFRGLWWSALAKRGMSETWCLITTSVIFAAFHFELLRFPILLVLGLAIGYGRFRTGRIGASIAGHALINTIGMIFLLIELA